MLVYLTTVDTGLERETIKAYAHRVSHKSDEVKYESSFAVPASFGKVGAILLENEHHKEMYRGVARNTDLGGPGCNRDIPNIIFKSIGYKIINFLILLYT